MPNANKIARWLEFFLGICALISIFIFLQLNMSAELSDQDIWLHLKTGEYITQNKTVPGLDFYSALTSGKTWINHSPLTQVIFYWAFNSGGPDRLIYLSCCLMFLAFLLLFFSIYQTRDRLFISVAVLALTIFASVIRFNIRPENFSVLFFCAYLFVLTKSKNHPLIFILPLIQLLWVNCHGFFILGPALLALQIIAEGLRLHKKLPWSWEASGPLDKNGYRNLIIVFVLSTLACLANPNGLKGALYPLAIIVKSMVNPSVIHSHIRELFPPWRLNYHQVLAYYALLSLSFISFIFNFRRINLAYLLCWLALLGISFNINRNIIFFNCLACVACVDNFSRANNQRLFTKIFSNNFIYPFKYLVLIIIILFSAKANSSLLNNRYYTFDEHRAKSALFGTADNYPNNAADFILKNKLPDNLFNAFNHGSYLIYRLYPENHVFIDGRTELYANQLLNDYLEVLDANPATINKLLEKHNINSVLLSADLLDIEELISYLYQAKEWALVYLSEDGMIFIRQTIKNKALAEKLRVDVNKQQIKKANLKKIGFYRVSPAPYIKLAKIFFALGELQKAELQAKEALSILPSDAEAYIILAKIYLRKNNPDQAYQYLRLALIYPPNKFPILAALSDYYLQTGNQQNAEKIYRKITQLYPRYAQSFYLLGSFYENSGNLKTALACLLKATKLAPYSTKYLNKFQEVAAKTRGL